MAEEKRQQKIGVGAIAGKRKAKKPKKKSTENVNDDNCSWAVSD
jgi:hypothetical protein